MFKRAAALALVACIALSCVSTAAAREFASLAAAGGRAHLMWTAMHPGTRARAAAAG